MSIGIRYITLYFVLIYWLPLIGNIIFHNKIISTYKIYPLNIHTYLALFMAYFLFLAFTRIKINFKFSLPLLAKWLGIVGNSYLKRRLYFAGLAILLVGLNYFLDFNLNTYRYGATNILEKNSLLLILGVLIKTIVMVDLFYVMFISPSETNALSNRLKVENILLGLAFLLLADGTINAFLAFAALLYGFFPQFYKNIFYTENNESWNRIIVKFIGSLLIIGGMLICAWMYGEMIKISSKKNIPIKTASVSQGDLVINKHTIANEVTEPFKILKLQVTDNFYYFIERPSVYYYSLLMTTNYPPDFSNVNGLTSLLIPIHTLFYRIDHISRSSLHIPRPKIISISQLNYQLLTTRKIDPREGTSPGIIGSFNYVFNFPFNIILCALYMCCIAKMFDVLLNQSSSTTLSISGIILVFVFLQIFLDSPFDFLDLIDDGVIYIVLIISVFIFKQNKLTINKDMVEISPTSKL